MKKILLLLLFITGTLYAQPPIAQPDDLTVCDDVSNNGVEAFDLTINESQTLNGLNPANYTLTFHESSVDANFDTNSISNPSSYQNIIQNIQTIHVRVEENANTTNFATTSFDLIVNPIPQIVQPNDLVEYESPFDGVALFDLNTNVASLLNGLDPSTVDVMFYLTFADAQANVNPIAGTSYQNISNPQTIYAKAENLSTGCFSITTFDLVVVDSANGIIYIPDVNFKTELLNASVTNIIASGTYPTGGNYVKIDSNSDGEVQFSEALNIQYLNVYNSDIEDLTGIEYFTNLIFFNCGNNNIATLNLNSLNNLEILDCQNNDLQAIDISGLTSLKYLNCYLNDLTILDVSASSLLEDLSCGANNLTTLTVSPINSLTSLNCSQNNFTALDLTLLTQLNYLNCSYNQLGTLDVSMLTNLIELLCHNNQLTILDVSTLTDLVKLTCIFNQLTDLDLSMLPNLSDLKCYNNNLISLNIKNGSTETILQFSSNPNLLYICADYVQVSSVQSQLTSLNMNATVSTTYCSFTPGGNYNTITGLSQFDITNNGCDINDFACQYLAFDVSLNAVSTNSSVYTNSLGNYSLFTTQTGTYELTPNLENPTYFNVNPNPASVSIPVIDNTTTTQNFCITANGVHPDLEIVIVPIAPARPGFDAVYKIVYKNKGNTTLSQQYGINFFYDDNVLDFVSTTYTTSSSGPGALSWDYANLKPFENRSFYVTLNVNGPTETPAVNIGDVLTLTASILPQAGDENTFDNLFQFNQTVVGSYDPNDITCIQGDVVAPSYIGNYLHYVINFENTGTYEAENIVVKTVINPVDFDIATLRVIEASHNVTTRINGNIIEFIFQTINLDTGGHGNILLKIKTKSNLAPSDIVTNKADIYFDYNFPVETNFANTTFQVLSTSVINLDSSVGIYPNPSKDIVNIKASSTINSIEVYDVQGRIIQTKITNQNTESIDASTYKKGIYFLKIKTATGQKVEKLVKD